MKARAPGKLMLLGEYAVLHGGRALVAAVDRYAECTVTPADAPRLETPGAFAEALLARHPRPGVYHLDSEALGVDVPKRGWTKLGLGSSAATTVALTRALLPDAPPRRVFDEAHGVHREIQGSGSGADIAASTYGGLLAYRAAPFEVQPLQPFGRLLTVWTGQPASTPDLVRAVEVFARRDPRAHEAIMARLAAAAEDGVAAVVKGDRGALEIAAGHGAGALLKLEEYIEPTLFPIPILELQAIAGDYSVIVKPTGAGGGDLAWCIGDDPEDELKLAQDLESEGWPVLWLDVAPSLLPA